MRTMTTATYRTKSLFKVYSESMTMVGNMAAGREAWP